MKFFKAIAAALVALRDLTKWTWDIAWATAKLPLELFSTRPPLPHFEPQITKPDIVADFLHARKAHEAVRTLDRDAVDQLLEYCRAHRDDRVVMKLPKDLPPRVVASLVSMDDAELRKLAAAGIGQLRKFMGGRPHGIHGVPSVAEPAVPVAVKDAPSPGMDEHERMLWRIRARRLKDKTEPFKPKSLAM